VKTSTYHKPQHITNLNISQTSTYHKPQHITDLYIYQDLQIK